MLNRDLKTRQILYRLHYRIRKQGFVLNTPQSTIFKRHDAPFKPTRQLNRLTTEFGYVIQTQI